MTRKKLSAEALLSKALVETTVVEKELERAEDELAVAHAVLETTLPEFAHDPDVSRAVETTAVAKERVAKSAERLKDLAEDLKEAGGLGSP